MVREPVHGLLHLEQVELSILWRLGVQRVDRGLVVKRDDGDLVEGGWSEEFGGMECASQRYEVGGWEGGISLSSEMESEWSPPDSKRLTSTCFACSILLNLMSGANSCLVALDTTDASCPIRTLC